ncbi:MAG: tRNA (adenosine(37)-N6)-dimethylallyltransferase MiaA [Syntrophobacteraceae bacterium]
MNRSSASSNEPEILRGLPAVLIAGPTASGKTAISLELARRLSGEIVNADSMQVYRYMDIGTAKPTLYERQLVPHHLLDVADPDEPFDAARYLELARPVIDGLHWRGMVPLVVGGTGLYMKVLTRGICSGPPSDPKIRERLIAEEQAGGLAELHRDLSRVDPEAASRIHPHDRQRILRALEVFLASGTPLSLSQKQHGFQDTGFPAIKILLGRERDELYSRIERRVEIMLEEGLREEVERLIAMGYSPSLKSMQSLGYKQMAAHLAGELTMDEAAYLIKRETRRYAKRQLTWFRGDPDFRSFHADDVEGIFSFVAAELKSGSPNSD